MNTLIGIITLSVFMFSNFNFVAGEELKFNLPLNFKTLNTGTSIPNVPDSLIKNPSTKIDLGKFFSSSRVSSNEVASFLKEAVMTGINLSILIISITTQVLKGLLEALK